MISIVATLYRSEEYIDEFVRRCSEAAQRLKQPYELILVDDGSPDHSLEVALKIAATCPFIKVVELSRNFGHHAAMMCGLEHAEGDLVFLIDSDLEEDPNWLNEFHSAMTECDADVIYGVQEHRRERGHAKILAQLHYRLRRAILGRKMPSDVTTARLMRREYVEALLLHTETTSTILDLWINAGFCQVPHPVVKLSTSLTTYSLRAKAMLFFDTFVLGAGKILLASSLAGLLVATGAMVASATLFFRWLAFDRPPPGWTSVMLAVLLMGGAILSIISLIGLNLSKVAEEVRGRPRYIVRRIFSQSSEA